MTREEFEQYAIENDLVVWSKEQSESAIKALEQEPLEVEATKLQEAYNRGFEDCRHAVKKCKQYVFKTQDMPFPRSDFFFKVEDVMALKSVNPEPKTGHWIIKRTFPTKLYDEYLNEYKCSECYREIRCTESQLVNYPYCHCGAKMESEEQA